MQKQSKPIWTKTLIKKIEQASKKAPRFLFAYGVMNDTNRSAIFNTSSITPQYFLWEAMPTKFHHIPLATLCDLNESLSDSKPRRLPHALWSAWGTSIHNNVEGAVELCAEKGRPMSDLYVAVLDTKRLASGNLVLHEEDLYLLEHSDRASDIVRDQHLVFGVIPQRAFAVVPLSTLHEQIVFEKLLALDTLIRQV